MQGRSHKRRNERNARMTLAWHIEAFARAKTMPRLSEVMERDPRETVTVTPWEQMYAAAVQWDAVINARNKAVAKAG